jgi:hypothetical protein
VITALTQNQVIRFAAKRGITLTPEEVRSAIASGTLRQVIVPQKRILNVDADAWFDSLTKEGR